MPRICETRQHIAPDGSVVTVRIQRHVDYRPCSSCGASVLDGKLCDFPVKKAGRKSETCDRFCCDKCAVNVGPDRDYCAPHARAGKGEPRG